VRNCEMAGERVILAGNRNRLRYFIDQLRLVKKYNGEGIRHLNKKLLCYSFSVSIE
jgi:hypothetical protein